MKTLSIKQVRGAGDRIQGFYYGLWEAKQHGRTLRHNTIDGFEFLVDVEPFPDEATTRASTCPLRDLNEGELEEVVSYSRVTSRTHFRKMVEDFGKLIKPVDGDFQPTTENDVVVHLRLGDLRTNPLWAHGRGWTPQAVKAEVDSTLVPGGTVYVVSDEPDHPEAVETIALINGVLVGGEKMYDYRTLFNATRIVNPSNSMFAESAGKLGRRVYPDSIQFHPLIYKLGVRFSQLLPGEQVYLEPIRAAVVKSILEGREEYARLIIETAPVPDVLLPARNSMLAAFSE